MLRPALSALIGFLAGVALVLALPDVGAQQVVAPCRAQVSINGGRGQWVPEPNLFCGITSTPTPLPTSRPTNTPVPPTPVPCGKLQTLIDSAGSTLQLPACVYRETATITRPLTIDGQGVAEIRGSDVWTAWTASGSTWVSNQTVPVLSFYSDTSRCASHADDCLHPEQVYLDGQPVAFTLDASRHVVLTANPNGHTIEVTTRPSWIMIQSDNVTIKNMTMRHAGNDAQAGAISNWGGPSADAWHSNLVLDNDHLLYAHGYDVGLCCSGQTGIRVTNSEMAYAGEMGLGAYQTPSLVISGNHLHDNNLAGFNCDWECGGTKLVSLSGAQVLNNEVDHTYTGIWTDIGATNGLIQGNNVHDNSRIGIFVEISSGFRITGNTVTNNDVGFDNSSGIASATSANIEIDHNVLAGNGQTQLNGAGISAFYQNRGDAPPNAGTGIYIHDNQISQPSAGTFALNWWDDSGSGVMCAASSNNRGVNNTYHYPNPEGGDLRFSWCGLYAHLTDFQQTPGGQGGGYF